MDDVGEGKRTNNVCAKVDDLTLVDIGRELARRDMKMSAWLYSLIQRELYGQSRRYAKATLDADSD